MANTYHFSFWCQIPGTDEWQNTSSVIGESREDASAYLDDFLKEKYKHLQGRFWNVQEVSEAESRQIALDSWKFR